ncbi:MAG TPA: ferritin-like domain-containing protein [Mucilaginibacter sp.]|jgi:ferritin-like metal-binding protein YciE
METKVKSNQITDVHDSALNELFIEELQDMYSAEKQLINALPEMAKNATSNELRTAISNHLKETENHITRLEHVFDVVDTKTKEKKCDGMAGLIKEGNVIVNETEKGSITRDAGIISAAQKIEHYEIASYGTLKTMAEVLGYHEAVNLLDATLQEEKYTNNLLTSIALKGVNESARKERG